MIIINDVVVIYYVTYSKTNAAFIDNVYIIFLGNTNYRFEVTLLISCVITAIIWRHSHRQGVSDIMYSMQFNNVYIFKCMQKYC